MCNSAFLGGLVIGAILVGFAGFIAGMMVEDALDLLKLWDKRRANGARKHKRKTDDTSK